MKIQKIYQKGLMASLSVLMATGMSACGDLSSLVNNPQVQAALKDYLSLTLNKEVDGTTTAVQANDIQSIIANGKAVNYSVDAQGQISFQNLPADATELEVQYKDAPAPVVMPIDPKQKQNGKLVMRGVSRFSKGENGQLAFQENLSGFDFNRDGQFDEQKPQFVQQEGVFMRHDLANQVVQRFELKPGQALNLQAPPREELRGDRFFMPLPPQRPGQDMMPKVCGMFKAKEDGSIDIPRPNGEARNLKAGEFEINAQGALKIIKTGEPDTGRTLVAPPCARPMMPPNGCQPGPNGQMPRQMQPGMQEEQPMPAGPMNPMNMPSMQPGQMQPGQMQPGQAGPAGPCPMPRMQSGAGIVDNNRPISPSFEIYGENSTNVLVDKDNVSLLSNS